MKKLACIASALLITISFCGQTFAAEDEIYTITGYNRYGIVKDSNGNIIQDHAYCLDHKEVPPSNIQYTRTKLSGIQQYTKDHGTTNYTAKDKSRTLKIIINKDDIYNKTLTLNYDAAADYHRTYHLAEFTSTESRRTIIDSAAADHGLTITDKSVAGYQAFFAEHPEIMREAFANFIKSNVNDYSTLAQRLIWMAGHEDEFPAYLTDDGTISGAKSFYYHTVGWYFGYYVDDPLTNVGSLYNFYYRPLIEYIDNDLPDYIEQGYDAWVYTTNNPKYQNILGGYFKASISDTSIPDTDPNEADPVTPESTDTTPEKVDTTTNPNTSDSIARLFSIIAPSLFIIAISIPKLLRRR